MRPAEPHQSWDRRNPPEHPRDWDHHCGPPDSIVTQLAAFMLSFPFASSPPCPEPNGTVALFCESICVSHTVLLGVEVCLAVLPIPVHRPLEHFHRRRALAGYHAHVDACVRSVEELEGVSRFCGDLARTAVACPLHIECGSPEPPSGTNSSAGGSLGKLGRRIRTCRASVVLLDKEEEKGATTSQGWALSARLGWSASFIQDVLNQG